MPDESKQIIQPIPMGPTLDPKSLELPAAGKCLIEIQRLWAQFLREKARSHDVPEEQIRSEFEQREYEVLAKYCQIGARVSYILAEIREFESSIVERRNKIIELQKHCKHPNWVNRVCQDCGFTIK